LSPSSETILDPNC